MSYSYADMQISSCVRCSLHGENYAYPRVHRGHDLKVMFIGEAPGREEAKQHLAFVGNSGKELDRWIGFLGIDNYFITNMVRHRPTTYDGMKDRPPTGEETKACFPYLEKELMAEQPDFVVALGAVAAGKAFNISLPMPTLSTMIDRFLSHESFYLFSTKAARMIVLYHPSYVLRQKNLPPIQRENFTMRFLHILTEVKEIMDAKRREKMPQHLE